MGNRGRWWRWRPQWRPQWRLQWRPRRPRFSSDELHFQSAVIALVLAGVAVVAALVVFAPPTPPPNPPTPVTVYVPAGAVPFATAAPFWGANSGLNDPPSPTVAEAIQATPVRYVRWPGGAAGDSINYTSGMLTNSSGGQYPAVENLSEFVTWCRSIACHALLELPGEIDDPTTAAYYVAFTERRLGFQPDLWEIGNEPAIWTHFGIPWSQWNDSQAVNATPESYAQLVGAYITAIHAVDPAAPILGLPGLGTGMYGEPSWITATVRANGANLSGVGIHVYPAGTPPNGTATLAQFYLNLTGSRSLGTRIALDRAAIAAALPSNPTLPLYVTEYNAGGTPGSWNPYLYDFPNVPFIAGLVITGLNLNLTQMDVSQVQTPHAGAWLDGNGTFHPLYQFFRVFCPQLGPIVVPTQSDPVVDGVFQLLTESSPSGPTTLLVDNANLTASITVNAGPLGFAGVPADLWSWNGTTAGPVVEALESTGDARWTVPPLGLLMVRILPGPLLNATLPAHVGFGAATGGDLSRAQEGTMGATGSSTVWANAWSISAAEARWRWEICSTLTPIATVSPADAAPARTAR